LDGKGPLNDEQEERKQADSVRHEVVQPGGLNGASRGVDLSPLQPHASGEVEEHTNQEPPRPVRTLQVGIRRGPWGNPDKFLGDEDSRGGRITVSRLMVRICH
jgi:hypothetical protein